MQISNVSSFRHSENIPHFYFACLKWLIRRDFTKRGVGCSNDFSSWKSRFTSHPFFIKQAYCRWNCKNMWTAIPMPWTFWRIRQFQKDDTGNCFICALWSLPTLVAIFWDITLWHHCWLLLFRANEAVITKWKWKKSKICQLRKTSL